MTTESNMTSQDLQTKITSENGEKNERDLIDLDSAGSSKRPIAPSGGFLQGFLAAREAEEQAASGDKTVPEDCLEDSSVPETAEDLRDNIITVLKQIYDPEIPVNIYDMGLIYEVNVKEDWSVTVIMTLTSPNCPVAEIMPGEVEMKVNAVTGVNGVDLQLVWDPAWDMGKMSDDARLELGLL